MKIDWLKFGISQVICHSAGLIGSLLSGDGVSNWYRYLNKPFFTPPDVIFGPVWFTLYTLMGISLYLIWDLNKNTKAVDHGLKWFYAQLLLNAMWSFFFFGVRSPAIALGIILVLNYAIFMCIRYFWNLNRTASYVLIPYISWVLFATVLNFTLMVLN